MVENTTGPGEARTEVVLIDSGQAETYSDTFVGLSLAQGNLHITFATSRVDHSRNPPVSQRVISSRLVMPVSVARELHQVLGSMFSQMDQQRTGSQ